MSRARTLADQFNSDGDLALTPVASVNAGQIGGRRNLIINGAMEVAQRSTNYSQSPNSGNYHTVDRYSYRRSGTWSGVTAVTISQQSSGGPVGFKNFLRYAPTGSDATTPDNACMLVDYKLEGQDISPLEWGTSNAKTVTVSFYVRSSVTGTFCLNLRNTSPTRQYVKEYTISSANTWERKSLTFPGDTSGTWANDNGTGLGLMWFVSGDTDSPSESGRLVTADQWNATSTTNTYTANQSDAMTTSSGQTWDITGIQLEVGSQATDFEHRSFGEELALCKRYYQYIGGDTAYQNITTVTNFTGGIMVGPFSHEVELRAVPTITKSGDWQVLGGNTTVGQTVSADQNGKKSVQIGFGNGSGGTSGYSATLRVANDSNFRLTFDAEL